MATTKSTKSTTKKSTTSKTPATKVLRVKNVSVVEQWEKEGELKAVEAIIHRYAELIDTKASARDMKPLASGMFEAIDRYKSLKAARGESTENELKPVFRILKAANEQ